MSTIPPQSTASKPVRASENFRAIDYVVFAAMLIISAFIGMYYAYKGVHKCHKDYLIAGRKLSGPPVALSLTASFMSAVTVLGTPAEVYRFGAMFGVFAISYVLMVVITAEVFLPIYYRLEITSAYEYLELRYNRYLRLTGTTMFMILTILYTGIVIYSPSLALNQGFQLWGSVIATGVVCTFYCTLGGLKAVVWTDVFQFTLMISGFLTVIIRTMIIKGGIGNVLKDARQGGRLRIWDFNPSPMQRHTFWTLIVGGTFTWLGIYGVNQSQVQRYLACKTRFHAKLALYLNLVGLWIVLSSAVMSGLSMYSVYKDCDPLTLGLVKAPDQLMPFLVLDILGDFPGIPGLFVAATYSGTLSTVSSSINALAAVTVEDLVKPYFGTLTEAQLAWISMGMNILFGGVCLGMAGLASLMGGLLQAALSIFGIVGGPLFGIFSLGILFPFGNAKGAFSGLISGFIVGMWVGTGSHFHRPPPHRTLPLPLSTAGCEKFNLTTAAPFTTLSTGPTPTRSHIHDNWYSVSYLYFSTLATLFTVIVGVIVSLSTGGLKQEVDRRLLFGKEELMSNYMYLKAKFGTPAEKIHPTEEENPE
ncbi:sodium-coupled monocarboxylate transporter 1-like isoform X2 [Sphaerodactylus townsendi]|uniref:sodium-coupled monocarboxylate transporter 1-like isoform X2 n=1 Tax=Sphaerodactylus townsendi TaxID=933632 RepID=UPI002025F9F6|nr:sodium-coupled monocarboxylate transporter 1-like isoform X2 [Sphaerodactylus townsendi]